ncbi:MAG: transglycosylase SLT domain-containing protein [Sphingobacteriales bacterium]|nr:transglycosylase SLT domain-containing protein [Sphingobacteriales bacterium]
MCVRKILPIFLSFAFCLPFFSGKSQSSPPSQYKDASSDLVIPTEEQLLRDDPDPIVLSAQISVRLKKIQHIIPLDYNEHVQTYISYNTKRKTHISKMLGRAKKFFPVFEPILSEYGVPDEMKYLAVVESALNPFAVSPKGASGPWQFMYSTALRYDLNISKRVDERRDPYRACEGAARYLKEMYDLYGNWHLAIASYNCGPGNVNKAIKKAGGSTNFWDIRPYLPAETRAYVPSFIATVYAMKYAQQYGIIPLGIERETTQRVTVREKITVNDLESLLNLPRQVIIDENPSLLTTLIPADFTLNLPSSKIIMFNQYQDSLYVKAEDVTTAQKLVVPKVVKPESSPKEMPATACLDELQPAMKEEFSSQPVVKGQKPVAKKNAGSEKKEEETTSLYQKLKSKILNPKEETVTSQKSPEKEARNKTTDHKANALPEKMKKDASELKTKEKTPAAKIINPEFVKEDDETYKVVVYTVKGGDNLGYVASWFHCKVKEIRRWNELNGNFIDVNDELLIYVHENDFKKFVRFNYLSNRIKDLLSSRIQTQEEAEAIKNKQLASDSTPLVDKINPVKILAKRKDCFEIHTIKSGENLWVIAQKYDDVTVQDLMQWNSYKKTPLLHKGDKIKVQRIECK